MAGKFEMDWLKVGGLLFAGAAGWATLTSQAQHTANTVAEFKPVLTKVDTQMTKVTERLDAHIQRGAHPEANRRLKQLELTQRDLLASNRQILYNQEQMRKSFNRIQSDLAKLSRQRP